MQWARKPHVRSGKLSNIESSGSILIRVKLLIFKKFLQKIEQVIFPSFFCKEFFFENQKFLPYRDRTCMPTLLNLLDRSSGILIHCTMSANFFVVHRETEYMIFFVLTTFKLHIPITPWLCIGARKK
jgi:hypothetical protein